ncbi:uncharacterized protein LOC110857701 isoform X2 [Folsomia candida]|nr:uncharacterized protein LOC110857701 isoform X2 [Folsomia candida]
MISAVSASTARRDVYTPPDLDKLTSDARSWYLQGVTNANASLRPEFQSIVDLIAQGTQPSEVKPLLKKQLESLLSQVKEANDNTKILVPRLGGLVDSLNSWAADPICLWAKMKLKATLWFLEGKRDNKSYYLLNGGGLWCKERVAMLSGTEEATGKKLRQDLDGLQDTILEARDTLDDAAQIYVQGVTKLIELVKDVGSNGDAIRKIVGEMKASGDARSGNILKSGDDAVAAIKEKIDALV